MRLCRTLDAVKLLTVGKATGLNSRSFMERETYRESRARPRPRPGARKKKRTGAASSIQWVIKMEQQYYMVQVATGETALPDFDYLIERQSNFNATVILALGLILGVLIAFCFKRR